MPSGPGHVDPTIRYRVQTLLRPYVNFMEYALANPQVHMGQAVRHFSTVATGAPSLVRNLVTTCGAHDVIVRQVLGDHNPRQQNDNTGHVLQNLDLDESGLRVARCPRAPDLRY